MRAWIALIRDKFHMHLWKKAFWQQANGRFTTSQHLTTRTTWQPGPLHNQVLRYVSNRLVAIIYYPQTLPATWYVHVYSRGIKIITANWLRYVKVHGVYITRNIIWLLRDSGRLLPRQRVLKNAHRSYYRTLRLHHVTGGNGNERFTGGNGNFIQGIRMLATHYRHV